MCNFIVNEFQNLIVKQFDYNSNSIIYVYCFYAIKINRRYLTGLLTEMNEERIRPKNAVFIDSNQGYVYVIRLQKAHFAARLRPLW